MVFQVPKQIAFNFAKLEPGFMAQFSWLQAGVALVATIGWLIFLRATPRSPFRGLTRWTAGLSLFWLLTMSLGLFFGDLLKSTLIGLVIGTPVLLAVLWLMAHMGAYWWFYVWLFWSAFNLLLLFIYPTWIAPLFNKFTPLEDGELKERILGLLSRCGFAASGLFVMSRKGS